MATIVGPDGRPHHVYTISGVRVEFPAKAYPSQIAMMDKVIRGLQRGQHCLLESPTGSGKTLALLCASLAWQRAEAENVRKHNEAVEISAREALKAPIQQHQHHHPGQQQQSVKNEVSKASAVKHDVSEHLSEDESAGYDEDDDDDDDFQPTKRHKMSPTAKPLEKWEAPIVTAVATTMAAEVEAEKQPVIPQKQKIPKIFFGTRTHKQIAQVVKEFRRTTYCRTPMAVLASREHTCIHPEVSRNANKNEGCKTLNDPRLARQQKGGGCSYRHRGGQKLKSQNQLRGYGYDSGWDIEDLVKLGRQLKCCPYYASRDMMEQAYIVFCPYNYLIDPRVRQSMKIPINNNVIILDEAHNIEDSARESAGGTFSQEDFRLALNDCEKVANRNQTMVTEIKKLADFASYMSNWIDRRASSMTSVGIDREVSIMSGTEFVASLSCDGYGPETITDLKAIVDYIFAEQIESEWMDQGEKDDEPRLSSATQTILEGFLVIMGFLLGENQLHRDDYRAVVVRTVERKQNKFFKQGVSQWTNALNLWCLNPAVVLKEVRLSTRSIIVTSGTLSPLSSYQSELDIDFKITLEANHVIPANRVWIGSISHGPQKTLLNGTFKVTSTFDYQDELGRLVLSVCQTVPHGILCFLPSYSLLEKLVQRWESTGLWQHMSKFKTLVSESRESSAFEETLKSFYGAVHDSERDWQCAELDNSGEMDDDECPSTRGVSNGALMLAVCRGKVSEGLDFTDNNARAVICVGIPFPNFKDAQVELKRSYNDAKSATSNLLKGSEWYEIQAFRALNQALGRCIRHKADWGAILLVDDRFGKIPRYVNQLSKWVRSSIKHYQAFDPMMDSLKTFTKAFVAEDTAELLATQKQEPPESPEKPNVASPYFMRPLPPKVQAESPRKITVVDLSDDEDEPPRLSLMSTRIDQTPQRKGPAFAKENNSPALASASGKAEEMRTPHVPESKKKQKGSGLLNSSTKLSLSQQKRAAENGSRYFQTVADPSGAAQSKFIP